MTRLSASAGIGDKLVWTLHCDAGQCRPGGYVRIGSGPIFRSMGAAAGTAHIADLLDQLSGGRVGPIVAVNRSCGPVPMRPGPR
jgi:hypothetical protein